MTTDPVSDERARAWRGVRRLLAVRVDNLGDVLMTTPALAAAAASAPGIEITLLGGSGASALAPHLPMVHDVMTARVPWVRHEDGAATVDDAALVARLAERCFDAAVVFTVCTQSALPAAVLCRLAGIPLRVECGTGDGFCPNVEDYVAGLHPRPAGGFPPGGHNLDFWRREAPAQLAFAAAHFA